MVLQVPDFKELCERLETMEDGSPCERPSVPLGQGLVPALLRTFFQTNTVSWCTETSFFGDNQAKARRGAALPPPALPCDVSPYLWQPSVRREAPQRGHNGWVPYKCCGEGRWPIASRRPQEEDPERDSGVILL